jgi:hypothetical protein
VAKLGERFTKLDPLVAKLGERFAKLGHLVAKLGHLVAKLGARFATLDPLVAKLGARFAKLDPLAAKPGERFAKLGHLVAKLGERFAKLDPLAAKLGARFATLDQFGTERGGGRLLLRLVVVVAQAFEALLAQHPQEPLAVDPELAAGLGAVAADGRHHLGERCGLDLRPGLALDLDGACGRSAMSPLPSWARAPAVGRRRWPTPRRR